jgi:hypothetical protein
MKTVKLAAAISTMFLFAAVVKAEEVQKKYTCSVLDCSPVQPNGGTGAQKTCGYAKNTPAVFVVKSMGSTVTDCYKLLESLSFDYYKIPCEVRTDKNGGLSFHWFNDWAYVPLGRPGVMFLMGMGTQDEDIGTLSYALANIQCVVE